MERKSVGGVVLLIIGIAMLIYVFYQGYLLFELVSAMEFETPVQVSIPTPTGDIAVDIPGMGSMPVIIKAVVTAIYLGILISVGSKIAGIGINLMKKT